MMLSSPSRPSGRLAHRKESRVNLTGIDDATKASPWYLGRASHKQAVIALDDLEPGAFVVRVSQSIAGAHILSFIDDDGDIRNEVIKLGSRGLRLKRSKVAFPFLSDLISFYSDPSHGSVSALSCVLDPSAMSPERQAEALAVADLETDPGKQLAPSLKKSRSALAASSASAASNTLSPNTAAAAAAVEAGHASSKPSPLPASASMPVMRTRHGRHATDKDGRVLYVFDVIAPRKTDKQKNPGKWPAPPRVQRTRQPTTSAHPTRTAVDLVDNTPISSGPEDVDAHLNRVARAVPSLSHQHWIVDNITNWVFDDPVFEWAARDVQEWLHSIDCAEAARTFREHGVDGQAFATMTPRDIQRLGLSRAVSEEIYKHLQALMQPSAYSGRLSGPGPMSRSSSQSSVTGFHFDNRAPAAPVSTWDKFAVRMWMLYEAGYDDHVASIFLRAGIDGPALLRQTDSTLRDLGIEQPEDRAAILESIAGLSSRPNTRGETGTRPADIRKWSSVQVAEFLEEHGFGHHASKFLEQHVMGAALAAMQHDALIALGIHDPIERTRLLRIVRQHTSQGSAESPFQGSVLGHGTSVRDWTTSDVRTWLRDNNMGVVADQLDANDVDGQALLGMDREDLQRMGVQDVDRLMEKLEQLRTELRLLASNSGSKLTAREQEMLAQSVADAVASRLRNLSSEDGPAAQTSDRARGAARASIATGTGGPAVEIVWRSDTVTLVKGADDETFGFRLGGGSGHDGADRPTVLDVLPRTPADGKLMAGDVLVAANGRSLEDGDLSDVKRIIVRAGSTLTLQIRRPIRTLRSAGGPVHHATPMAAHMVDHHHRGTQYEMPDGSGSGSGGVGGDGDAAGGDSGSLTRMTPGVVSSFYRTAAHLRDTYEGQQGALDEEPELRLQQNLESGQGDLSFTGEDGDTIAAMDFADYELANTLGGSAPRPGLGLRSMPLSTAARDRPAVGTPAHARPSSLLSNRSSVTGEATFAPQSQPAPYETPEFMRRRTTLRRTHALANAGKDGEDDGKDMESLVRRTDNLLMQQSSFDRLRTHNRFRPSNTATPDRSHSVDVTLSPMSHANPLSWSVSKVVAFFQSENCPEVAKQCKKRKLSGSALLRMDPHDIINEWGVSDSEEAERAARQVLILQEQHPCPLAARWSVADVGEWLDHNSLGQLRRPFSKKKIDGVSLCLLRQGQLDSLNVPQHLRHPLMAALANVQHRTEPEETEAEEWSVPEVVDCLIFNDLHSAIPSVQKKKVTGEQLLELTQASLYNMGIRKTDVQTALLNVVARLREKRGGSAFGTPLLSAARASNNGSAFWDGGSGLRGWTTRAVCDWLAYNGLGEHCQRFFDADVSGDQLAVVTSSRLEELGVGLEDSERLLDLIDVAMARQRATSPSCVPHGAWSWTPLEVQMWLTNAGLDKHSAALESHQVDGVTLVFSSDEDLKKFGVEGENDRKLLLDAVEAELARNTYPLVFAAANWTQDEVAMWMRRRQHDDLVSPVQTHNVDGEALLNLKAVDLVKLGVPAAVQDILLADIDHLRHVLSQVPQRPELPQEWSSDAVAAWMHKHAHAEFAQLCRDLHIGGHVLIRMRAEDLDVLGIQDPDIKKGLMEIKRSRRMSHTVSAGADLTTPSKHTDTTKAADWSLTDVSKWLARVGLGEYKALFQAHSISGPALLRLTPDDLDRLGIRDAAHRSRLLTQVANLRRGYLPTLQEANEEEEKSNKEERDSERRSRVSQNADTAKQQDTAPTWLEPELEPSQAKARLTHVIHKDGAFLIHAPLEKSSAYTVSVVANDGVMQIPIVKRNNKVTLDNASEDFTTLDDLVAFYSVPENTRATPLPCALAPGAMETRDRPISWQRRSRTAESRPSWDRRFVAEGHVDVDQLLAGRRDGSFFVVMEPGTEKPVLNVVHGGEVVAFPMHEAECKTTGTIGYALDIQPGVVYATMAEMVDTLRQEQGPLPVLLAEADVSKDIKQVIENRRREEPWCWWQLDKPKPEAEAVLEGKHTGAFVVYRDQADPSSFVLAYKMGNSVHRERVYHTPQAGLFNKGFHLAKAQHKVLPSLRRLVDHYTHTAGELECRLRVSIEPDPSLSIQPQPVRASKRTPRSFSWLYLQKDLAPETILGSRGKGAFIVKPSQRHDSAFELVYKKDQTLLTKQIRVKTTDAGAFGGFFLESSPKTVFPTLQDLVLYHQDASHTLECTLNVRQMCLFSRPHPAASAPTSAPTTWVWCQVGVPSDVALKELHEKPRGAFIVFGYTHQEPGLHLAYKTSDSEHTTVDVVLDEQTGRCTVPALGDSTGGNLEHALIKVFEDEEHSNTLTWPPQPKINGRLLSPGIVRVRTNKEKPWNWWQLDKDPEDALKELEGTRDGAFVIRPHPSGAAQKFVLSYKFQDRIVDEEIIRTPSSSMFSQGFVLGKAQQHVYPSLQALVKDYKKPGKALQCPLRESIVPDTSLQPTFATPPARPRGKTFESLKAAVQDGQEATRKWRNPSSQSEQDHSPEDQSADITRGIASKSAAAA